MLDSGADRDVISETIIEDMGITTREMDMRVVTVDNSMTNRRSLASFTVESVDGSYRADVDGALVGRLLTGEGDVPPHRRDLSSFPHLQDVNFDCYNADVSMIICAAHTDAWIATEVKRGPISVAICFQVGVRLDNRGKKRPEKFGRHFRWRLVDGRLEAPRIFPEDLLP